MPFGGAFVSSTGLDQRRFTETATNELQADRWSVTAVAAGLRQRRISAQVERAGEAQKWIRACQRAGISGKGICRHRAGRHRGASEYIDLIKQRLEMIGEAFAHHVSVCVVLATNGRAQFEKRSKARTVV